MTKSPIAIPDTLSMREAAAVMSEKKRQGLPVIDKRTGVLVSILTSADVMRDLLHVVNYLPAAKDADLDSGSSKVAP
jgi:CBS domain-containing protein